MPDPAILARLRKTAAQHKYDHGHALVLAGGAGNTGAARLAAMGALRVGAGLVTVAAPAEAQAECAAQLTAIMLRQCDGPGDLRVLLRDARLNAVCLGPGLGVGVATRGLVVAALEAARATVLDADALSSFADAPATLFARLRPQTVLTPHDGEIRRLFPDLFPDPRPRADRVAEAARRAGCVVVSKGAETLIADPEGRGACHAATGAEAAPWLATAGSGDVLAGIIAGLMARGLPAFEAAETGVDLHARAARRFGPGLIAEDLPAQLPAVFRDLGL